MNDPVFIIKDNEIVSNKKVCTWKDCQNKSMYNFVGSEISSCDEHEQKLNNLVKELCKN